MAPTIWTVGYERLLPAELVAELQAARVQRLIDVRYRPQSRRAGMSKTRLSELLGDHGIAYEHRRELGTPPDIRWYYKNNQVAQGAAAYRAHVEAEATEALDELAAEVASAEAPRTALMCLEAEATDCHRRIVVEQLRTRVPALRVVDL